METRFAGSQRLDERRRRRLAAGSDGAADESVASEPAALSAPAGSLRYAHRPATEADGLTAPELPLTYLLPAALWKHLLIAATLLTVGGGLVAANFLAERWAATIGSGVTMLFGMEQSPATAWYASLLLLLCSQTSGLIWWGRSRSAKDFDGRYRVWTKIAVVFFAGSAGLACHGHKALSATVRFLSRYDGPHSETVAWLVPVAGVGALLLWALHREMRGCRLSLSVVYTAIAMYAISTAATLELVRLESAVQHALLVQATVLAGHVLLLHAMLLHARHVLYHTAEPNARPKRKWSIPRPHFRWPSLRKFRKAKVAPCESSPGTTEKQPAEKPAKAKTRIDARHESVAKSEPVAEEKAMTAPLAEKPVPRREETRPAAPLKAVAPEMSDDVQDERDFIANSADEGESDDEDEGDDQSRSEDDWSGDDRQRGNLKGLSKKQRRRLQQEQRDRERHNRR